ncbi:hypothetical protein D7294_22925 [Streptomyces hoynatensis]|uniref:Uncharacterized protein n=1 Tax=Streptomyces hoynatensis TaxID=1141874 RepID=A0A3A9YSJ1_9ACTN|nr:hypothetical protein D7294_22925 [Streptomyces hoynatensis]
MQTTTRHTLLREAGPHPLPRALGTAATAPGTRHDASAPAAGERPARRVGTAGHPPAHALPAG